MSPTMSHEVTPQLFREIRYGYLTLSTVIHLDDEVDTNLKGYTEWAFNLAEHRKFSWVFILSSTLSLQLH